VKRKPDRFGLAAATDALQLFFEGFVEFLLLLFRGRLLIWQYFSCFWLAVANWGLT